MSGLRKRPRAYTFPSKLGGVSWDRRSGHGPEHAPLALRLSRMNRARVRGGGRGSCGSAPLLPPPRSRSWPGRPDQHASPQHEAPLLRAWCLVSEFRTTFTKSAGLSSIPRPDSAVDAQSQLASTCTSVSDPPTSPFSGYDVYMRLGSTPPDNQSRVKGGKKTNGVGRGRSARGREALGGRKHGKEHRGQSTAHAAKRAESFVPPRPQGSGHGFDLGASEDLL